MRKILTLLLIFTGVFLNAQEMPIYSNARVYGYLIADDSLQSPKLVVDSILFPDGTKIFSRDGLGVDSVYVTMTGDTIFYNYAVKFTGESGTEIDSNSITADTAIVNNYLDVNGNADLNGVLFTGSTKTAGAFYTGTNSPSNTNRLNYDGYLYATEFRGTLSSTSSTKTPIVGTLSASSPVSYGAIRANAYDSYGYGLIIDNGSLSGGAMGNRAMLYIDRDHTSVSGDITNNIIEILDNPSASGNINGNILSATIGSTERISLNPRATTSSAYWFDTHNLLTGTLFAVGNQGDTAMKIRADSGLVVSKSKMDTLITGDVELYADSDTLKAPNFWARFKGFLGDIFTVQKITTDTLIIGDSTITDVISLKEAVEAERFSEFNFDTATYGTHSEGRVIYDESTRNLVFQNDISGFNHNLGYEFCRRVYNGTGATISNGKAVRRVGTYSNGDIIASVALAGNSTRDSSLVYGITTVDIAPGTIGVVTRGGDVRGLNIPGLNDTVGLLGFAGDIIDTCPEPPYYCVKLGDIIYSDNDSGQIDVNISDPRYYPNPIFSASFSDSSISITNSGQNVYAKITNATNNAFIEKRNVGFTFQGDSISPNQDGNYTIFYSYSFQGDASVSDLWRIGTFVNNTDVYSTSRTSSSTNNGGVPYPVSVYLNAGDWVSVRVTNTQSGTRNCTFIDSSIAINYSE